MIPAEVRARVRESVEDRCGYCLSPQKYVLVPLEIDHIMPLARGGTDDEENLWLACRPCNVYKGTKVEGIDILTDLIAPLFNPRFQRWAEHFQWSEDGIQIFGLTATGRVTVEALNLNNSLAVAVRKAWVEVGWHPPDDSP